MGALTTARTFISNLFKPPQALSAVPSSDRGWFNILNEGPGGWFQRGIQVDNNRQVLAFSAVYACVTLIAADIGKLRIKLTEEDTDGVCSEIINSPFLSVLNRPNKFQTRNKFIEQWVISKLLHGNAYALKQRDRRGPSSRTCISSTRSAQRRWSRRTATFTTSFQSIIYPD